MLSHNQQTLHIGYRYHSQLLILRSEASCSRELPVVWKSISGLPNFLSSAQEKLLLKKQKHGIETELFESFKIDIEKI